MGLGVFLRKTFEGDRKLLPGHSQTEKEKSEKLAIFAARLTDMKVDTERKNLEYEKKVLRQMMNLYCRRKEGNASLCPQCTELLGYALKALERCRFGEDKPSCRRCPVHCYRPDMRERIRTVMRWAGPRLILFHPVSAIRHLLPVTIRRPR